MVLRVFAVISVLFVVACSGAPAEVRISGETMGTTYNIVVLDEEVDADALDEAVKNTLVEVNAAYSNWDPQSEISQLNANVTTEPINISGGLVDMIALANRIHDRTGGKLDLTLKPVIDLWGFGPTGRVTEQPAFDALSEAMQQVGQTTVITLDADRATLTKSIPDASIDLSSIAKGHGIDALAEMLRDQGAENFLIEIGGDLYTSGLSARGTPWRIGIERPMPGIRALQTAVEFSDKGMATSGDYRNYFEEDGVRFSHIINPQTGRPITHKTASVTVIAEDAMTADAWATALLALGADQGLAIANQEDLAVLFIVRTGDNDDLAFNTISNSLFDELQTNLGN